MRQRRRDKEKTKRKYRVQKNYNLLVIWFSDVCPDSGPYFWKSGYRCGLVKRLALQVECQMLAMPLESPSGFGLLLMASLLCTLLLLISCLQWEFKFPCRFSAGSMSLSMDTESENLSLSLAEVCWSWIQVQSPGLCWVCCMQTHQQAHLESLWNGVSLLSKAESATFPTRPAWHSEVLLVGSQLQDGYLNLRSTSMYVPLVSGPSGLHASESSGNHLTLMRYFFSISPFIIL